MLRRFLKDFEQRVEGAGRKHVHLVDDIDAVTGDSGGEDRLAAQVPDRIDAVVGSRVDLHHVEQRAVVHTAADGAFPAGAAVAQIETVDRLGDKDVYKRQAMERAD